MTKKTSRKRKEEHHFNRTVIDIDDGAAKRDAARLARLPSAIFQYTLAQRGESKKSHTYLGEPNNRCRDGVD